MNLELIENAYHGGSDASFCVMAEAVGAELDRIREVIHPDPEGVGSLVEILARPTSDFAIDVDEGGVHIEMGGHAFFLDEPVKCAYVIGAAMLSIARRYYLAGKTDAGWATLLKASIGVARLASVEQTLTKKESSNALAMRSAKRLLSAAGLDSRHAENRAMKKDVFVWLDANMRRFKSMDAAAEAIAGKIAPIAWRTARDWVGEWKKLRSTGTP